MKNVVVFTSKLLPPSEPFIAQQARALRRWHPIMLGDQLIQGGLPLTGLDVRMITPPSYPYRLAYRLYRLFNLAYPPSLKRLNLMDASLLHVHFGTNAVDIWPLAKRLELPMLVTLHGYDINITHDWWKSRRGGWHRRRYHDQLLQLGCEQRVRFIAVSEAVCARAIELGIPAEKLAVHYIGVDVNEFRPNGLPIWQRVKSVLFVGRLVDKKGVQYLIQAFRYVRKRIPSAELHIIGDGPLRGELEQMAAQLHVPATFFGERSTADVIDQLNQARVLCLPSVTSDNGDAEGLGMVLIEAQASGVPVVTSARGGATEAIIDGETGFRFNERDSIACADYLVTLLDDDELLEKFSAAATRFSRAKFDLSRCTSGLENQYDMMQSTYRRT